MSRFVWNMLNFFMEICWYDFNVPLEHEVVWIPHLGVFSNFKGVNMFFSNTSFYTMTLKIIKLWGTETSTNYLASRELFTWIHSFSSNKTIICWFYCIYGIFYGMWNRKRYKTIKMLHIGFYTWYKILNLIPKSSTFDQRKSNFPTLKFSKLAKN
jgi:hypothetical protein